MSWNGAQRSRIGEMESEVLDLSEMVCPFADGGARVFKAGDAFHVRAGHLADVLEDAELIEFTAADDYRRKAEHLGLRPK